MSLSWSQKRRFGYIAFILLFLLCVAVGVYFIFLDKPPLCTDGLQNGVESGIDCGGNCSRACRDEIVKPIVRYERLLPVDTGFWSAAASIENPNQNVGLRNIPYSFKIYDTKGAAIAQRQGTISLPPRTILPIFSGVISLGNSVPVRAGFVLGESGETVRMNPIISPLIPREIEIHTDTVPPSLTARIQNTNTVYATKPTIVVGLVFDAKNNVVGVSQTTLASVPPSGSQDISFVWRKAFSETPVRAEVSVYPAW